MFLFVNLQFKSFKALDVYEMVYKNKVKNGFFIEAGAADCKGSVTLPFEDKLNWTGLLVEAVPTFFRGCLKKDRRATLINTCLGMKDKPHFIGFDMYSSGVIREVQGKSIGAMPGFAGKNPTHLVEVQCFPLYTLLAGMGNPTVHLFVLDIEGFELGVLRHIPWDKVDIQVFSIETDLAGHFMDGSREEIIQIMEGAGYVRKDIVKKYNVVQL
ncbi:protein Star isoform X2 [Eurytemora carolleeae]|uniref:protein Star isoform X1 n=1 Tax=Eurytemora carolleeae TaxID=1294199 RepID=UPI000C762879|nr:protein Star isoform X1 [Eurytemora carolleeae]XP_023349337.1 protein Star isoform X2 [Eurytemora carolleeae]|eukprot:XP_023349336.1 protein Star-like isoform X1 [Eurytemora affinis]